jgi:hypothetical protein
MTLSPNPRIASHALGNRVPGATIIRRWAVVRLILGVLQMFGAAFSLGLIVHSGITPRALTAVIVTGMFTGISMFLFQVSKREQIPDRQSAGGNRIR